MTVVGKGYLSEYNTHYNPYKNDDKDGDPANMGSIVSNLTSDTSFRANDSTNYYNAGLSILVTDSELYFPSSKGNEEIFKNSLVQIDVQETRLS